MGRAMNRWAICSSLVACTGILTVLLSPATSLAATCEQSGAKAMAVEGKVDVRHTDETQWQPVKLHDTFCPGDVIRVQERSRADIALANQPMLRLDQNTTMTLGGEKPTGGSIIELVKGATHFFSRLPRNLEIRTAFVNAGVEGTEGVVRVTDDKAEITIFEGKVVAANEGGTLLITNGQSVVAEKGKAPSYQTVVKPRDAVQWALYYPPIQDVSPEAAVNEDDPRSLAGRAARSLAVGRVDEANVDLDRALNLDPKNSDALALQSVMAVVQNDKDKALALAQQAVATDSNSASARIALSYAQQAQFNLEGARDTMMEAVRVNPDNALVWARLAELYLSLGEGDRGVDAAEKGVDLDPNLSKNQTVLGFAYLVQVRTKDARRAFEKAIKLDQADALPRLGLGLAKFRDGDIKGGRREMEVAASLDPNNALIRSYLGKAYFEEKRTELTDREYKNAKELDPKDPTPFFYDALQKQLTNRPVEALKDMEKAIELNKNRAVYRSQLQIDSDLAARSSSLARIYTNLGFQQLALVEGWLSLNTDPTNFTAHRFLADSYSSVRRHEVARVSELLESQLLQPLNVTPVQPGLAESNLLLLGALGAGTASFNEFNTLMVNRDRLAVQANGVVGTKNTLGGETIVSGIFKKVSISGGWTNFQTDGWRTNANQNDNIGNLFLQYELSPETSVQAEYRNRRLTNGDVVLNFFPDDFSPNQRMLTKTQSYRVGARQNLSPNSILIGSFMYQRRTDQLTDSRAADAFGDILDANQQANGQKAYSGEGQYLFRSRYMNAVAGYGYFKINKQKQESFVLTIPSIPLVIPFGFNDNLNANYNNIYLYDYLKPLDNLTVTLGVSADLYDVAADPQGAASKDNHQVNPKFGLVWNPFPGTTVRAAAFRTLKRVLITDQTLEPTQVAGFNQFWDDLDSSGAWRYGAAINQKFSNTVFAGVEYSQRDISDVPIPFTDPFTGQNILTNEKWHEKLSRNYLFWTPHDWLALTAEYQYEHFQRGSTLNFGFQDLTTHRVPLGIAFFHPSGVNLAVKATWVSQYGDFLPNQGSLAGPCCVHGSDDFWLVDANIGYRLPKRYGLLTVGATNLLNQNFRYQETDFKSPLYQPTRMVLAQLTLAF